MILKKIRFFDARNKHILPPTAWYVLDPYGCDELEPIPKTLWMIQKEIPEDVKERFAENIMIQTEVLDRIKTRNEKHHYRCGLINLPTWKGKSHVIMDITEYYQTNTLILVHNTKTLSEMIAKFKEFSNITPTQYGWGKKELWPVTVMTKSSFIRDFKNSFSKFNLIICDEAPISFNKNFWCTMNKFCHGKKWVAFYGLSWTPQTNELDENDMEKYFWKTIKVEGLENNGYNMIPEFHFYDYLTKQRLEFETPAEMRTAVFEDEYRMIRQLAAIKYLIGKWKCLLVITDRKLEAEEYMKHIFHSSSAYCFLMTWNTKVKDDDINIAEAKKRIDNWENVVIVWTLKKVWVWVDIPFIDTLFLAPAIKFEATVIQAIGRALRKYKNKDKVLVAVWNDLKTYKKQRWLKLKAIKKHYGVDEKDITFYNV